MVLFWGFPGKSRKKVQCTAGFAEVFLGGGFGGTDEAVGIDRDVKGFGKALGNLKRLVVAALPEAVLIIRRRTLVTSVVSKPPFVLEKRTNICSVSACLFIKHMV